MRQLVAVLLAALIVLPIQVSATSDNLWDNARVMDSKASAAGTIGGPLINLDYNSTNSSEHSISVSELPSIVEVYTATWCTNCIKTEQALDEAIGIQDEEVIRIHYHRFLYETIDPFGSNSTDSRWVDEYGTGSIESSETDFLRGMDRVAPSKVFDGERMYTGVSTKSNSLTTDYSTALALGSSHPFEKNGSLKLSVERTGSNNSQFSITWGVMLSSEIKIWEVNSWLMFVEESAYFPEGSNGKGNYSHVLHEAVNIGPLNASSILYNPPETWDGDDMTVVLLVDWSTPSPSDGNPLPAPALSTLLCMLAALVPRRNGNSEPLQ